jgi:hypothetical protein
MATIEAMPAALERVQLTLNDLYDSIKRLQEQQQINEPPIDSKELMKRLAISEPTLIRMRKRKDIPFLKVCGHTRYVWLDVLKALANKKNGGNKK